MGRFPKLVLGAAFVAVVVWSLMSTINFSGDRGPRPRPSLTLVRAETPMVVGWEIDAARRRLDGLGIELVLRPQGSTDLALAGRVLDQKPLATSDPSSIDVLEVTSARRSVRFDVSGIFLARKLELDGRMDLRSALRGAGLFQAVLLPGARPRELTVYPVGNVYVRTEYVTPNGDEILVTQSNGIESAYGLPATVRGIDGIRAGDTLRWTERGYSLSVTAEDPDIADHLEWIDV